MLPVSLYQRVSGFLSDFLGETCTQLSVVPVGGGCINETARITCGNATFFLKYNKASSFPGMFRSEARGLKLLGETSAIGIPGVIHTDDSDEYACLVLSYIEPGKVHGLFWERFGIMLSELHKNTQLYFGLDHDNYIGSLPQGNRQHTDWITFFTEERLLPQIKLARDHGRISSATVYAFDNLFRMLPSFFPVEKPSLLHGDLWSGNFMPGKDGEPYIFDPAVYYGHREMDIAMSRLFGGFENRFYEAYNHSFPLEKGWESRLDICNLYPLMVHVNLFGGAYASRVERILHRF